MNKFEKQKEYFCFMDGKLVIVCASGFQCEKKKTFEAWVVYSDCVLNKKKCLYKNWDAEIFKPMRKK